jgi:class 3 adenylate cyclase/tetratricopeptide (TPR) repeat protein
MRFCGNCGVRLVLETPPEAKPLLTTGVAVPSLGVLMGSDLAERLRQAGIEATGQRRNVTVLFTDLSGYTSLSGRIDSEDLYDIVQQFIAQMINNVYKYEGVVDKLTGDGLMALFGAPISHENNAERGVRAALDMQNDLIQLSRQLKAEMGVELHMRVGLHSGSVIVGGIGSDSMMNYTAIGDTVNLAHRIEEAAPPGRILVSESVYRQVRAFFDCQQVAILNPKGIAHPVVAYSVVGLKARPGSTRGIDGLYAPMIGRDQELIQLKNAVESLLSTRKSHFAVITGEAGLGKTRLTSEFKAFLDQQPVLVLEGQSLAYRRVSYWLIREALYNYLRLPPTTPPLQVRERLSRQVYQLMGTHTSQVLPFLEHLLSLPYSEPSTPERLKQLDAGQLRQRIFLAVRDLLIRESYDRPLVIILDDLHWADEASLDLLQYLMEPLRQSPVFFLAISRTIPPGSLKNVVDWAERNLDDRFYRVHLQSLSLENSKQLLYLLLSIPDLPEKLREQILTRAAGVPFYLEEILRMLIDQGVIRNEHGRWVVVPGVELASLGVPDTLQGLILARFDRLENVQKHILQVASVIGKDFSIPVLGAVLRSSEPGEFHTVIDFLVEREFIMPQPGAPDTEYTFRHVLMSDAIYSTMLRKERSALHGKVGEVIEEMYAGRLEEQIELLANHYRWSPKLDKALHYLILAGQKAVRNHVYEQARGYFDSAHQFLLKAEHLPYQEYQVHTGLGDTLAFVGEYPQARQHFQDALVALYREEKEYSEEQSSLNRRLGKTHERQGEYDQALDYLSRAEQILNCASCNYPMERAETWSDIAWIHFRRANFVEARNLLHRALWLVEDTNAYAVIASIYNRLGGVAYNEGDWDQAVEYLRKSISIREAIGDMVGLASSSNNLGNLEIELGQFDNALETLSHYYDLVRRLGQVEGIAVAHNNLGWLHILRGEPEEARRELAEALELASQIGYSSLLREVLKNQGELHLALQEWEQAIHTLSQVAPDLESLGANDQLLHTYLELGEASLGLGDVPSASHWLQKSEDIVAVFDGNGEQVPAVQRGELCRFRGMLSTRQGDLEAAQRDLEESKHIFEELHSRFYLGRTTYQMGVLAEAKGEQEQAERYFSEAGQLFSNVGAKLEKDRVTEALERVK